MTKKLIGINFFVLNNTILFYHLDNYGFYMKYLIDCKYPFLSFSPETKEFKKEAGFGRNDKFQDPDWWKRLNWKEMSKLKK